MLSPRTLGAPRKFSAFHPQQYDALMRFIDSDARFMACTIPTGGGKSLCAWALGAITGLRTLILTATKQLQSQYEADFSAHRLVDIRGQQNYVCRAVEPGGVLQRYHFSSYALMCDKAPCHHGVYCKLIQGGCEYYDAQAVAHDSPTVLSNYDYWLAQGKLLSAGLLKEEPLGQFELIVCDEADEAVKKVSGALKVELREEELRRYIGMPLLMHDARPSDWAGWAQKALPGVNDMMGELRREVSRVGLIGATASAMTALRRIREGLERVSSIDEDWVITRAIERSGARDGAGAGAKVMFEAVEPARYCEELLYRGVGRIVLMSATLTERDVRELGAA